MRTGRGKENEIEKREGATRVALERETDTRSGGLRGWQGVRSESSHATPRPTDWGIYIYIYMDNEYTIHKLNEWEACDYYMIGHNLV